MMTFKVVDPGLFSTVQDAGRTGYQAYGFSPSGAMDYRAHQLVNKLLGNDENAAVLEMTLYGLTLEVLKETVIATAGAEAEITVDDVPYGSGLPIRVMRGETLKIGKCRRGARIYLGAAGGFDVPEVLGSRSTHTRSAIGGFKGRTLKAGDVLRTVGGEFQNEMKKIKSLEEDEVIRIIPGQQYERFSDDAREQLFNSEYEITKDSDRMGFRLSGPELAAEDGHDVLSEPTQLGSIQVPKNGQPIILLNDRQTAGGYARIATVALADIPKLVQKTSGETITFKEIDVDEAVEEYRKELERIKSGEYFEPLTDFTSVRRRAALKITKLMGV